MQYIVNDQKLIGRQKCHLSTPLSNLLLLTPDSCNNVNHLGSSSGCANVSAGFATKYWWRLCVTSVAAGTTLLDEPLPSAAEDAPPAPPSSDAAVAKLERIMSAPSASTSTSKPTGSKWVIDDNENLKSTLEHRAWTYGCMALMTSSLMGGLADVHSTADAGTAVGAVFTAYLLSDLGTAIYHWAVDNYGGWQHTSGGQADCRLPRTPSAALDHHTKRVL